ncbi:hypothetical protein HMPREF0204_13362 [Chryseobacterium gleum ATCC 35910]|uniref:Uncharacterized protein n=1 Tax=Chryseobacterium gleum ATCC 35910 TaxID=525257 RepID=A0ABN0AML6_CHRGE|nr:hypothetical protein HMPREF0204_13362 [Chryseobacterium gleum ATCC 35910]
MSNIIDLSIFAKTDRTKQTGSLSDLKNKTLQIVLLVPSV